jgi:t-SNARE complex subunit (syntaxin)
MVNACQEVVQLIQNQGRKWQKAVQFERDARVRMERMCEQVASQSAKLEKQIQRASRKDKTSNMHNTNEDSGSSEDDDEFHDAESVFRIP